MAFRILVAEPDSATVGVIEPALAAAGHRVISVTSFDQATRQLAIDFPDLLITAVRLGAFNGLHLVFRFRKDHPEQPAIAVGASADFSSDMPRYNVRFVNTPINRDALVTVASEVLTDRVPRDRRSARQWPRRRAELPAITFSGAARVVEMSYGGVRLELPVAPLDAGAPLDINLPSIGMSMSVILRWSKPSGEGEAWWCGAEVALSAEEKKRWRRLVDTLKSPGPRGVVS